MSPPITGAYSLKKQHAVFLRLLIGIILTEQPFQLIMAYLCVFILINHNDNFHVILWYTSQSPLIFRNAQCTYRHLWCSYLCIQLKMKLVYYTYKKKIKFYRMLLSVLSTTTYKICYKISISQQIYHFQNEQCIRLGYAYSHSPIEQLKNKKVRWYIR